MKRNRIALRLSLYFFMALLLFALVLGGVFTFFSTRQTLAFYREDLQNRAETISEAMFEFLSGSAPQMNDGNCGQGNGQGRGQGNGQGNGMGVGNSLHGTGFGAYMRFLDDIAMADVWVVDADSRAITPGAQHAWIEYGELPEDGEEVIRRALEGETVFSEGFSDLLGEATLSVGVPIGGKAGEAPLGAVLLHSPVQGVSDSVSGSVKTLLLSMILALVLAVTTGILLSLKFTKPLTLMKAMADQLAAGDFSAQNNLAMNDEIGQLASTMDQLAGRLAEASQESERLEQARRNFISDISHELRTPITVMRGSLEALADGVVSDSRQVEEYHRQMLRECMHLQRLVEDLLELSRLQNPDFKIECGSLELRQLSEDVVRAMRRVAEQKNVPLETSLEPGSFPLEGDYLRLRQMLLIVMDNAVKFSPEKKAVKFSLFRQNGRPVIEISDQGPGISQEEVSRIFQRFQKGGGEKNTVGTGLGLPIAQQIALRHQIEIQVETGGEGACFRFLFPLRKDGENGK